MSPTILGKLKETIGQPRHCRKRLVGNPVTQKAHGILKISKKTKNKNSRETSDKSELLYRNSMDNHSFVIKHVAEW